MIFRCATCNEGFTTGRGRLIHESRQHRKTDDPTDWHCKQCGKYFDGLSKLRFHNTRTHNYEELEDDKIYACEICGKKYISTHGLQYHRDHQHSAADKFKWPCGSCGKRYPTEALLKTHNMEEHRGGRLLRKGYSSALFKTNERSYRREQSSRKVVTEQEIERSFSHRKGRADALNGGTRNAEKHAEAGQNEDFEGSTTDEEDIAGLNSQLAMIAQVEEAERSYEYGKSMPSKRYKGPLQIPMWASRSVATIIHEGAIEMKSGGAVFVFEIPRDLVLEVVERMADKQDLTAIRYGPTIGIFEGNIPEGNIQDYMVEGVDYTSKTMFFDDAKDFLLADLDMEVLRNSSIYRNNFLW